MQKNYSKRFNSSYDSILIRLDKVMNRFWVDSKNFRWLWLNSDSKGFWLDTKWPHGLSPTVCDKRTSKYSLLVLNFALKLCYSFYILRNAVWSIDCVNHYFVPKKTIHLLTY